MTNEIQPANNISPALAQIMSQETPRDQIRTRPGKGGRVLLYTDGAYVIRTLNEAFAFNWDFEADHEEILYVGERPFEARCRGKLIIRAGDVTITKMQYGSQPIEMLRDGSAPVSLGDAYKGAATDALKKCASLLGIALDLYDSDSEINTANPQQVQREIQQARQQAQKPVVVEQTPQPAPKSPQKPLQQATGQNKRERPLSPADVKASILAKPAWKSDKKPGEKQATHAFTSLSKACEGDEDTRHIVIEYLFGVESMKDLTAGQCSFIIDWCGAKAENEYTVNPDTMKEIDLIVKAVISLEGMTGEPAEEIAF